MGFLLVINKLFRVSNADQPEIAEWSAILVLPVREILTSIVYDSINFLIFFHRVSHHFIAYPVGSQTCLATQMLEID